MKDRPALEPQDTTLARSLSEFDITMIGVGAMIGAGIFVLIGIAAGASGPAVMLALVLNGVVTLFTAMVYAELGSAIPEAGGGYLWVKSALGPAQSFLAGWMSWFSHAVAGALYAQGFGSFMQELLHQFDLSLPEVPVVGLDRWIGVAIVLVFLGINLRGASETGLAGNIITLAKVTVIGLFIAFGIATIVGSPSESIERFDPMFPEGFSGVLVAMGITFIAFEGYEIIVQAGEEVKEPSKTIPKAIFKSLIIVIPIYALVAFTAIGAVDPEGGQPTWQFLGEAKELGLAEAAARFMPAGTIIILVGGLLSTISALNATTYSSTRVSFAMGRDGTLPSVFEKVHDRFKTPYIALAATGVLIIVMVVSVPIEDVAAAADVMFLLLFLQVNYAVIKIRGEMGDRIDYGYRMPWFPAIPIIGIISNSGLAVYLFFYSALGWAAAAGWIGIGLVIFYAYARGRTEGDTKPQVTFERKEGPRAEETILVPVANPDHVDTILSVGLAIARQRAAEVVVLNVIQVPPQVRMDEGRRRTDEAQPVIDRVEEARERSDIPISLVVGIGRRISSVIAEIAERENSSMVVVGWHGHAHEGRIRGSVAQEVLLGVDRDVLLVRDRGLPEKIQRITAAVSPGLRGPSTTSAAVTLAAGFDADLRLLNVVEAGGESTSEMQEWIEGMRDDLLATEDEQIEGRRLHRGRIDTEVAESDDFLRAVRNATAEPGLLVVGASRDWYRRDNLVGGVVDDLTNRTGVTVAVIRPYEPTPLTWWRQLAALLSGRRSSRSRLD